MDKVALIVSELEYKVKKIVNLQNVTFTETQKQKKDIHSLHQIIEGQKNTIKNLEEKIKVQKITKTLEYGKDTYQTKLKINELVREIDKSIALLNK
jgi:hypothetical protein